MGAKVDVELYCGDCLAVLPTIPDASIDLIATDPPYFKVKAEAWDRQWKTPTEYLAWIGRLCSEWRRVLKPNGSLYCFASPQMAARVECKIAETFEVMNSIVWNKLHDYESGDQRATAYKARDHGAFRKYFDYSERIIFAEQPGADSMALGESGYAAQCERLHGFVFEPLRAYLDGERRRAGIGFERVREIVGCAAGSGLPSHWFTTSQWMLPTETNYLKLRSGFDATGGNFLRREYEDLRREYEDLRREYEDLRREYEDLRREYEDLRRPFTVSANVPYTDVWDFPTVPHRTGKHPCEKPLALMEHMVKASTRPGATVLDCFMGSGVTGEACVRQGRNFIGIEQDPKWHGRASDRITGVSQERPLFAIAQRRIADAQSATPLFAST